jgi:hypothetical protein
VTVLAGGLFGLLQQRRQRLRLEHGTHAFQGMALMPDALGVAGQGRFLQAGEDGRRALQESARQRRHGAGVPAHGIEQLARVDMVIVGQWLARLHGIPLFFAADYFGSCSGNVKLNVDP